jgi:hypothetical protein
MSSPEQISRLSYVQPPQPLEPSLPLPAGPPLLDYASSARVARQTWRTDSSSPPAEDRLNSGAHSPSLLPDPASLSFRNRRSSPSKGSTRHMSKKTPHCNLKYRNEQLDFILYWNGDKLLAWKDVVAKFRETFPAEQIRGIQGLQGVFYRQNKGIPMTDENGELVFDDNDNVRTVEVKVREQNHKIGLLDRYPERAIMYRWVEEEDKRRVWTVG